jgi:hypothetical protein
LIYSQISSGDQPGPLPGRVPARPGGVPARPGGVLSTYGPGTLPRVIFEVLPTFRLDLLTDELRDPSDAREGPDPSDPG